MLMPSSGTIDALLLADRWRQLFGAVVAERKPAPRPSLFQSYVQGGFECSTHRRKDGTRLDLITATGHDTNTVEDYAQLAGFGITTVRDGLRWHLIEQEPGQFDWSSFTPMLEAAVQSRTEVIWDLMHYGWPDDIDIWQPDFVARLSRFATAAAELVKRHAGPGAFYCPINEISFLAWAAGDVAHFYPFAQGRGFELKVQLARASIEAMRAIRAVDETVRFVQCEPLVHVVANGSSERAEAQKVRAFQFQSWDLISGSSWPQLGGSPDLLDIIGVNYYSHNQWALGGRTIDAMHRDYLPLRHLLAEVYARYGRPILLSETGAEGQKRAHWYAAVAQEVRAARGAGVPVEGICLYPIIDHNDWDDDQVRQSGLLGNVAIDGRRKIHQPLASEAAEVNAIG
ncbi:beta-glucosidase [Nitratireductor aestuarii]|uniref:beta-glucosidase n=1 Tax=Nitratireductor aestuarii TaxID=1735103 RepID=UPI00166880CE|nr:beta-glucosidase [Nitratireductor aestuarii]